MSVSLEALISASTVEQALVTERTSKNTPHYLTCSWCGKLEPVNRLQHFKLSRNHDFYICLRCYVTAIEAIELGQQVVKLIPKGGVQLYIGIERVGRPSELVSVKRWNLLGDSLDANFAAESLTPYPLPQE